MDKVDAFIEKQIRWRKELNTLRSVFLKTELNEEIKWGCPTYTYQGKLVASFAAFKHHYALWFHQGVFLKDPYKRLVNAQEGKTKALRQWKFVEGEILNERIIAEYLQESIENMKMGKQLRPVRNEVFIIPAKLKIALASHPNLANAFKKLSPGKQKEFAAYIESAKREVTQQTRIDGIIPLIIEGKGLNDKYKSR